MLYLSLSLLLYWKRQKMDKKFRSNLLEFGDIMASLQNVQNVWSRNVEALSTTILYFSQRGMHHVKSKHMVIKWVLTYNSHRVEDIS